MHLCAYLLRQIGVDQLQWNHVDLFERHGDLNLDAHTGYLKILYQRYH